MTHRIEMTLHDERSGRRVARIRPTDFLQGEAFQRYSALLKEVGTAYDAGSKAHVVPIAYAMPVAVVLHQAEGFEVDVAPDLAPILRAQHAAARGAAGLAKQRQEVLEARGLRMFPYQVDGVRWLAGQHAALLADQMGLGKSAQTLLAAPDFAPVLVVSPACVKENWIREAATWRPELNGEALYGRRGFRWPQPGEILSINYDILPHAFDASEIPEGLVVIADEAHALKSPKAKRTNAFRHIATSTLARGGRVWLLTGTPMLNRPDELFHVLAAADLETVAFWSWLFFLKLFDARKKDEYIHRTAEPGALRRGEEVVMRDDGTPQPAREPGKVVVRRHVSRWIFGEPNSLVPRRMRLVSLRRRREDVLPQLPTKRTRYLHVDISKGCRDLCDEVADSIKQTGRDLYNVALTIDDLGAIKEDVPSVSSARKALAAEKLARALEIVQEYEDNEEPLVVFSSHRGPIEELAQREGWEAILGGVSPKRRQEIVQRFQAGELKGVALTIGAGGVGITLTRAAHMLFVDLDWTPAANQQAEDRCVRIGQTRGVLVTHMVANHVLEQRVYEALAQKSDVFEGAVDASSVTS